MIKVYVAGPYRADTVWQLHQNIEAAKRWGLEVALLGANPFVPHANTGYYDGILPQQFWLDADIEWLAHSDCMFIIPDTPLTDGVLGEVDFCEQHGIPVFHTLIGLARFIETRKS